LRGKRKNPKLRSKCHKGKGGKGGLSKGKNRDGTSFKRIWNWRAFSEKKKKKKKNRDCIMCCARGVENR